MTFAEQKPKVVAQWRKHIEQYGVCYVWETSFTNFDTALAYAEWRWSWEQQKWAATFPPSLERTITGGLSRRALIYRSMVTGLFETKIEEKT